MTAPDTDTLARLLAEATPGPWRWEVSLVSKVVKLCGGDQHKGFGKYDLTVMDFVRWGMSGAAPLFWTWNEKSVGDPQRADSLAVPVAGREHHERWFRDIDHPDARLIALAPELAAEVIALRAQAAKDKARIERYATALREILNCGQSAEPDHWKFRCMARETARAALEDLV